MSEQTKQVLKGYFETGDTPTEAQFGDLIDSLALEVSTNNSIAQLDASVVRIDALVETSILDISTNVAEIAQLDASVVRIDGYQVIQDVSIALKADQSEIAQLDASIIRIDGYFTSGWTGTFIIQDGSTITVTDGLITNVTS